MKIAILFVMVFSLNTLIAAAAGNKKTAPSHRKDHGAHVHGAAALAIAFDEAVGKIEYRGAAEGILGFEHRPKNTKDQNLVDQARKQFETEIGKLIQFEASLDCQFTKELIGQVAEKGEEGSGEHSDWVANFIVKCRRSPVGTTLVIDFSRFKFLQDVDITVLAGSIQKSAEFKKKPLSLEIK